MIALVEGANRQKTPNEIALNILLAALTIIFVFAVATLQPLAIFSKANNPGVPDTLALTGNGVTGIVMVSLLVCLIPTTIGALLSAIGIAGMDRLVQRNVLAMSGRAVEAAGDVNTLLLDKTGTITLGNRQAAEFVPLDGVSRGSAGRRRAAVQPRRRDARGPLDRRVRQAGVRAAGAHTRRTRHTRTGSQFTAQTRMSGVDLRERRSCSARARPTRSPTGCATQGGGVPTELGDIVDGISAAGGTPLVVGRGRRRHSVACSASSTSRTSSSRACGSGSTRCAGWASAP